MYDIRTTLLAIEGNMIAAMYENSVLRPSESCQLDGENPLEKVRVLCVVITQPENHRDKALAVKETWGQRCSELLFFSSQLDMMLPVVTLNVSEGREVLWNKTKAAVRYAWHKGLLRRNEWLLKADDDTYVVMENLRQLLQPLEPEEALYLGLHLLANVPKGYMSGGAGYVLSRGAVQRLVAAWDLDVELKEDDSGFEDINIGWWMEKVGATFVQTADVSGRRRFHAFPPSRELSPAIDMMAMSQFYREATGCCSDTAVSFHYLSAAALRTMEYLLYDVAIYGDGWCLPGYGKW
ncbi:glycoprotein-N-acetylgalactosamine 3-beta-galactosyltransferase 1-like [Schistocerca cancellata]|uniref:glycoprotein-N-acetylgalactosamine 3-beta-galactosyltransferase 1-like n=1 Tax=Schistocerca cancellata TaxID=274614 RepID=UPI002118E7C8|nr:glycoprotein-N-acetylgalactosamine 3-beta-galactosyltransferase 1-like [Schistocerca cancellata]